MVMVNVIIMRIVFVNIALEIAQLQMLVLLEHIMLTRTSIAVMLRFEKYQLLAKIKSLVMFVARWQWISTKLWGGLKYNGFMPCKLNLHITYYRQQITHSHNYPDN